MRHFQIILQHLEPAPRIRNFLNANITRITDNLFTDYEEANTTRNFSVSNF